MRNASVFGQPGQLGAGRLFHPAETQHAIRTLDVYPIEKQHVEVDIEVQRAAEALDQCDRAGLGRLSGESRLLDHVRGDAAVNNTEHTGQDLRGSRTGSVTDRGCSTPTGAPAARHGYDTPSVPISPGRGIYGGISGI